MRYSAMTSNGFGRTLAVVPIAVALLSFLAFSSKTRADDSPADPVVARRMTAFYEVYTGRKLTPAETRGVVSEFIGGHSRRGKSPQAIRELSRQFGMNMILLREVKDGAAALTLRHQILDANYFAPTMQNTLELKLLTEPDPVRVVDARARRLMTQRDVIGLANLWHFATSDGAPRHSDLSRQQVDELVALLEHRVGTDGGTMPQFFTEAGPYWAGVRQQWPYLTAQQRSLARAYARDTWQVSMPIEMYARLWGHDPAGAQSRWTNDVSARIRGRPDSVPGLAALRAAMNAMFESERPAR